MNEKQSTPPIITTESSATESKKIRSGRSATESIQKIDGVKDNKRCDQERLLIFWKEICELPGAKMIDNEDDDAFCGP